LQGHPITETITITNQQTKPTDGCHKSANKQFMTAENLVSLLGQRQTKKSCNPKDLIGPGFSELGMAV
jgi:hypothetical protein